MLFGKHNLDDVCVDDKSGSINFKQNKRKLRKLMKISFFVLVAVISGAVTSFYIINVKLNSLAKINEQIKFNTENSMSKANEQLDSNMISNILEAIGPSVVAITNNDENSPQNVNNTIGSGIIFDSDGYIITSYSNIKDVKNMGVQLANHGKKLTAEIVGKDTELDLAVIKINSTNLPMVNVGDSSKVRLGDIAIVVGNSIDGSVTSGIISGTVNNLKENGVSYRLFKTDAFITNTSNGGALCNSRGEVIGINSMKMMSNNDATSNSINPLGYVIPSNEAKSVVSKIMYNEKQNKTKEDVPNIGINGRITTPVNNSNYVKGMYIEEVFQGSGAEKAGIQPNDIIIELDNVKIYKDEDMINVFKKHKAGDIITSKVWKNGKIENKNITLGHYNQ